MRGSIVTPDLSHHSVYSDYPFGEKDHIIDVGTQPLWVPTNLISEAMRRDGVLSEALDKLGFQIRFHPFLKGADVNFFLFRGDLDVAIGGDMPALTAAAGTDVVIASLIQQGFCSVVAHKPMLMRELRGKRIGYAFGSNAHFALLQALRSAELGETDVELVAMDVSEMPDAMDHGSIDAFAAWEPTPFLAEHRHENQISIHRSICSGYLYFSGRLMGRHPEAVRHIVAAELRALKWMKNRHNLHEASEWALRAGRSLTSDLELTSEDYSLLARKDLLGLGAIPFLPEQALEAGGRLLREFDFLVGLGKISDDVPWETVRGRFASTLLQEILVKRNQYAYDRYDYADAGGAR